MHRSWRTSGFDMDNHSRQPGDCGRSLRDRSVVDFQNPFAPPEAEPGSSESHFRMPAFLARRRLWIAAFILFGATALLIAFNVAGHAALTGSPEVLTWLPYFTLAATMATLSNRSVRSFVLAVHSVLAISFWAYCYSINYSQFFGVNAILWLLPLPAVLTCVLILTSQVVRAVRGLRPNHKKRNEQKVEPELPITVSHMAS